jgi:hypothetical protein
VHISRQDKHLHLRGGELYKMKQKSPVIAEVTKIAEQAVRIGGKMKSKGFVKCPLKGDIFGARAL